MHLATLNKENILAKVSSYEIINHYLKPFHKYGSLKQGQHISNPFLTTPQKTPSFNIYETQQGWRYKDFSNDDDGDIFDLIQRLNNCSFKESLTIINEDFQLSLHDQLATNFSVRLEKDWNLQSSNYWKTYGITSAILNKYHVKEVNSYTRVTKNDKKITVTTSIDNPIFAYTDTQSGWYKIYRPLDKKYKFSWLGNKPKNYHFGLDQLPQTGGQIFITGGEKDVLSLAAKGYNAISLNSETAIPSKVLIENLKQRFKEVIVLYDLDSTGKEQSEKLCKLFGLYRLVLPDALAEVNGKDISDFFAHHYRLEDYLTTKEHFHSEAPKLETNNTNLSKLLNTQKILQKKKSSPISFSSPILMQNDNAVFYPRTINVLQGKAGVHKSRLAEIICSALLKTPSCTNQLLDFNRNNTSNYAICYVDTERNLSEQLPYALQQIQLKAGYTITDIPNNFDFISLLEIPRKERFKALTEYLDYVREKFNTHIFIVLDVVTDCIKDFNRPEDSMELTDLMNKAINKYNVTFLCLIHENPGSIDKARGHLGTEIMNKASTVIQVGFEKGKNGEVTELICVKYLKCRSTKKHEPFYLEYSDHLKGLILADDTAIDDLRQSRKQKASLAELSAFLQNSLAQATPSSELVTILATYFDCSSRIIRDRLKELITTKYDIITDSGIVCHLHKRKVKKEVFYELKPI